MVAEIREAKDYAGAGYLGKPADFLEKKLNIEVHAEARINAELNSFYGNNENKESIEAGQRLKNTDSFLFPETDIRCTCESISQYERTLHRGTTHSQGYREEALFDNQ